MCLAVGFCADARPLLDAISNPPSRVTAGASVNDWQQVSARGSALSRGIHGSFFRRAPELSTSSSRSISADVTRQADRQHVRRRAWRPESGPSAQTIIATFRATLQRRVTAVVRSPAAVARSSFQTKTDPAQARPEKCVRQCIQGSRQKSLLPPTQLASPLYRANFRNHICPPPPRAHSGMCSRNHACRVLNNHPVNSSIR